MRNFGYEGSIYKGCSCQGSPFVSGTPHTLFYLHKYIIFGSYIWKIKCFITPSMERTGGKEKKNKQNETFYFEKLSLQNTVNS